MQEIHQWEVVQKRAAEKMCAGSFSVGLLAMGNMMKLIGRARWLYKKMLLIA